MISKPQHINQRQNEPEFLELLYAADVAHSRAQFWEATRWFLVATSSILAIVASFKPGLVKPLAIASAFVVAVTAIGIPQLSRRSTAIAALMQETFDVDLFGLPWNDQIGSQPFPELRHELSGKFSGDPESKKDWYLNVAGLSNAYAILLCQRENLVWDFRQRRSWAYLMSAATAFWLLVGLILALLADWTVRGLFLRWLVPSMPILVVGTLETMAHLRMAQDKEGLALKLESQLAAAPSGDPPAEVHEQLLEFARCLQDRLAESRKQTARVPSRFYRRRRPTEQSAAAASGSQLRCRLLRT